MTSPPPEPPAPDLPAPQSSLSPAAAPPPLPPTRPPRPLPNAPPQATSERAATPAGRKCEVVDGKEICKYSVSNGSHPEEREYLTSRPLTVRYHIDDISPRKYVIGDRYNTTVASIRVGFAIPERPMSKLDLGLAAVALVIAMSLPRSAVAADAGLLRQVTHGPPNISTTRAAACTFLATIIES